MRREVPTGLVDGAPSPWARADAFKRANLSAATPPDRSVCAFLMLPVSERHTAPQSEGASERQSVRATSALCNLVEFVDPLRASTNLDHGLVEGLLEGHAEGLRLP